MLAIVTFLSVPYFVLRLQHRDKQCEDLLYLGRGGNAYRCFRPSDCHATCAGGNLTG